MNNKICFIIASFSSGGVNKVISNLANEFSNRGIQVDVVSLSSKFVESKKLYNNKVKLITLNGYRATSFIQLTYFFFKNKQYDNIISSVEFVNVHTIISSKLSSIKAKVMLISHTNLSEEKRHINTLLLKSVYKLARFLYPMSDYICAVSSGVADSIEKELGVRRVKIKVIYNPIVKKSRINSIPKIPHEWYKDKVPVLVGCGRLTKQKNFRQLLDVFSSIVKTHKIRLIILGDGEKKDNLSIQIKNLNLQNSVLMLGNVKNPLDYFFYSKVFIMTSLWEGFGNVIVEALSVGCPVIATDCPSGPIEILENGRYGELVKLNDNIDLYNKIIDNLDTKIQSRKYLQERANDFRIDIIANQYLELLYSKVV